jgi:hypothetical protein
VAGSTGDPWRLADAIVNYLAWLGDTPERRRRELRQFYVTSFGAAQCQYDEWVWPGAGARLARQLRGVRSGYCGMQSRRWQEGHRPSRGLVLCRTDHIAEQCQSPSAERRIDLVQPEPSRLREIPAI